MDKANDNQAPEQGSIQESATNVETTAIHEDSNMPPYKQTDIAYAFIMPVIGFLFVRYGKAILQTSLYTIGNTCPFPLTKPRGCRAR